MRGQLVFKEVKQIIYMQGCDPPIS